MEAYRIEYKVKEAGKRWEDIEPVLNETIMAESWDIAKAEANQFAQEVANGTRGQVRWEWVSIGQGHYIDPQPLNTMSICWDCEQPYNECMCAELLGGVRE